MSHPHFFYSGAFAAALGGRTVEKSILSHCHELSHARAKVANETICCPEAPALLPFHHQYEVFSPSIRSFLFTNPNQFSANPNHFTVSQMPSPSGRTDKRCMISRSQIRESITRPTCLLYPGRMQPCVSSAVLPAWIRIPLNSGTFSNNGSQRLNLGEKDTATA